MEGKYQMESKYLRSLSASLKEYRFILIYGAGGVAVNLLILLSSYISKGRTFIVVSNKKEKEDQLSGYPIRQINAFIDVRDQVLVILAVMPRMSLEIMEYIKRLGFQNYMTAEDISNGLYQEIWGDEIRQNKIVFSNWSGGGFGGNAKYIALDLMKRSQKFDLVWVVKGKDIELPDGIRKILYGTYEHYQELGTAHIWI